MSNTIFTYSDFTTSESSESTLTNNSYDNTKTLISVETGSICTIIGGNCFGSCSSLSSVILSESVERLASLCFFRCTSLTSIIIPNKVYDLQFACFAQCSSLTSIVYDNPSIIREIGTAVFENNPSMNVKYYLTSSAPLAPSPATGIYDTSIYPSGSTFRYYSGSSCYNKGTLILCLINNKEEYVKIEDLKIGDLVKTYKHGFIKIKMIGKQPFKNNSCDDVLCMYKINNLYVTGGHYILVDELPKIKNHKKFYNNNLKIDDKYCLLACDYEKSEKITNDKIYTVYHLVLNGINNHYIIYVNDGFLSETTNERNFIDSGFY
jgi:hypothetical protein